MSKYDPLWKYLAQCGRDRTMLSFEEIRNIVGFELDHSFLNFKKELLQYGYQVGKISLKGKTVIFLKTGEEEIKP